ncbi:MAG: TrbI/VirB10 family protein [Pseudomonadota bacterium]
MAINDRDETIEEEPSTYNRKAQRTGIFILAALLIVLCIGTIMRLVGGGTQVTTQQTERGPVDTRQSPEQEDEDFLNRLNRAERNQQTRDEDPRESLIESLRGQRDEQNNPAPVAQPQVDEWQQKELERVRLARYDDYDLDLGFESPSTRPQIQTASTADLTPNRQASVNDTIANVRREIARANAYKAQIEQGGARAIPAAGSTAAAPQIPLELGHTRSNSVDGLPQEGQKLLPVTTVIRGVLDQKIISDYVGPFRARIIEDVYDVSNRYILIPKGSTIDGRSLRISNVNEPIQARMALTVNWVVLPNGHKLNFSRQYALDREGVAAVKDKVNRHFLAQFLGVAAYAVLSSETSRSGTGFNSDDTFAGDIGESARREFAPLAQKYLRLVPTITLRPGTPIRVYIAEELYITPWATVGQDYASNR